MMSYYGSANRQEHSTQLVIERMYRWGYGKDDANERTVSRVGDEGGVQAVLLAPAVVLAFALPFALVAGNTAAAFLGTALPASLAGLAAGALAFGLVNGAFPMETRATQRTPRERRAALRYRTTA